MVWGSQQHASAIRTAVILIWLLILVGTPYSDYSGLPVDPSPRRGLGLLVGARISSSWLVLGTLRWMAASACVALLLTSRLQKLLLPFLAISVTLLDSTAKSFAGFANHAQVAPLYVLWIFAAFSDGSYLPPRPLSRRIPTTALVPTNNLYSNVVWLVGAALVIPYTYIGVHRLVVGGPQMFQGSTFLVYLAGASRGFGSYGIDIRPFRDALNFGFLLMTLLEITSVAMLTSRLARPLWLVSLTIYHIAIFAFMNILFWENVVLLWVVFWWGWGDRDATVVST